VLPGAIRVEMERSSRVLACCKLSLLRKPLHSVNSCTGNEKCRGRKGKKERILDRRKMGSALLKNIRAETLVFFLHFSITYLLYRIKGRGV